MLTLEVARAALPDVSVLPLREDDLPVADRIMRLAFGTFLAFAYTMLAGFVAAARTSVPISTREETSS